MFCVCIDGGIVGMDVLMVNEVWLLVEEDVDAGCIVTFAGWERIDGEIEVMIGGDVGCLDGLYDGDCVGDIGAFVGDMLGILDGRFDGELLGLEKGVDVGLNSALVFMLVSVLLVE